MASIQELFAAWRVANVEGSKDLVALPRSVLVRLVEHAFGPIPFDEKAYLEDNPDVAVAVDRGDFLSGKHHYMRMGLAEGRTVRTRNFDEVAYLIRNPDVKREIDEGKLPSGRYHWVNDGWIEGRID